MLNLHRSIRPSKRAAPLQRQRGFILMENLLSVAIFAIGAISLLALLALSIADSAQSRYRNEASLLAGNLIAQTLMDIGNLAQYADGQSSGARATWNASVNNALPCYLCGTGGVAGQTNVVVSGNSISVVVRWRTPDEVRKDSSAPAHSFQTLATVQTAQ